eukprot:gnl/TRDRNA2_/TRDRNA2_89632_c1_seq1.p1 gnl/TRDRNA2_/TRDRNA2_89632_c1~~gnl/TRDRNA2_/TRDRNA2_89632_c1_seq1.p1  ORF type:complete len:173 (+),score=48.69 gnl/TRDRNA2_/TRDRNA2_89632_c1_seq1:76-519(+)
MAEKAMATGAYSEVETADAEDIPMADSLKAGTFDAVLCVATAGYLARGLKGGERDDTRVFGYELPPESERVRDLLKEWLRLLRPDGILGVSVEAFVAEQWEKEQQALLDENAIVALESPDPTNWLPKHEETPVRSEYMKVYFFQKKA